MWKGQPPSPRPRFDDVPRPSQPAPRPASPRPAPPRPPALVLPDLPEEKNFGERLGSLFAHDCFRITRIFETAQYALLYVLICLPVGLGIDWLCKGLYPKLDEEDTKAVYRGAQFWQTVAAATLQVVLSAVSIIYVRKLADLVPFFFNFCPARYVSHYHVEEVFGEIAIAMVFVGSQTTLLDALARLRRSL